VGTNCPSSSGRQLIPKLALFSKMERSKDIKLGLGWKKQ
jgi:hypothetical protein